jgi:ABC-2 type transport system permease protein
VNAFVGTAALVRLAMRRDRVMLPIWLVALVLVPATSAPATVGLYPTEAGRIQASETFNHAQALVAIYGKVYDPTSIGALAMVKLGGLGAIFVALLSILLVVRHTRAEEETGRQELVGATVVGRRAPLAAALLMAAGTNLALGVLTALGLVASGLPADGSFAFGLAWAGVGLAFAAIAAITAQLTSTARAATGLATAILGAVYVLRAVGDTADRSGPWWLTWLSPIGWGQQFRPYAGNRWWVLLITVGFAVVAVAGAYALVARRDLGAGLVPDRPGPAAGAPGLGSPLALAWRLHRGNLFGWAIGFALAGLAFGNIATSVGDFLTSPQARQIFERLGGQKALTDTYLALILGIVGVMASAYGVQAAMRMRTEETALRLEPLLATKTSRISWILSHTLVALLGAALVQVPAAWVLTGIVVAAFGIVPRLAAVGWAALAGFVVLGEVGPLLKFDQWVLDLSPYAHTPKLPGAALEWTPLVLLTLVALLLTAVGFVGFRRRDIPVT